MSILKLPKFTNFGVFSNWLSHPELKKVNQNGKMFDKRKILQKICGKYYKMLDFVLYYVKICAMLSEYQINKDKDNLSK